MTHKNRANRLKRANTTQAKPAIQVQKEHQELVYKAKYTGTTIGGIPVLLAKEDCYADQIRATLELAATFTLFTATNFVGYLVVNEAFGYFSGKTLNEHLAKSSFF